MAFRAGAVGEEVHGGRARRAARPGSYAIFLLLFAALVFLSHAALMKLPYYWDEAGQFVPAALDVAHDGAWIPHSTLPNVHPPAVPIYLAEAWKLIGFQPASTRAAMLLVGSFALLAAFLLAIELLRNAAGMPAFLAVALLAASPLFFAQSMLAQLDAPAMLFTTLALLFFLQERMLPAVAVCTALVLVKETGIVVPLVFFLWLCRERRWHHAILFTAPAAALAVWLLVLKNSTGFWMGNPGFLRYNLLYPLHPVRVAVAFLRRIYYLGFASFHWIGTAAIVYAWRKRAVFANRAWHVAWWMVGAHVAMLSVLGGATLERYLLPVMPIVYTGMAAALSVFSRKARVAASLALLAGVAASNFINPPYPFAYENNLAFTDFVKLQADAADYLQHWYPGARVTTVWPMTMELARPELGFVQQKMAVEALPNLSGRLLGRLDWSGVEVLVVFSRNWDPPYSLMHIRPILEFWKRFYGYIPNASMAEIRALAPFPGEAHFERHGQWVDIYVNPRVPHFRFGGRGLGKVARFARRVSM